MFERFTDDAVLAIIAANDHARELGHAHVGTEHLLLGLMGTDNESVTEILARHDVTIRDVRHRVCSIVTPVSGSRPRRLAFTAAATRSLEWALFESTQRERAYVGPDDVLLGVIHADGTAAAVLAALGLDPGRVYREVKNAVDPRPTMDPPGQPSTRIVMDMLAASDDVTSLALEALVLSRTDKTDELEARVGELVRLIHRLDEPRWLEPIREVAEIIDQANGEVRLRPKSDGPTDEAL